MSPARYRLPVRPLLGLARSMLFQEGRSFRSDALTLVSRLSSPPQVEAEALLPRQGPSLLVVNHYTRPGLPAWWFTLAVSVQLPMEVRWIITDAWVSPVPWITPLTRWAFQRVAQVYGFVSMPPIPPRAGEEARRGSAVRAALRLARAGDTIGLAPEGRDFPGAILGAPPPGAGRFLLLLAGAGLRIVPVGVYEATAPGAWEAALRVHFGSPLSLEPPSGLSPDERDRWAARKTMRAIARLLPERLRGEYQ